MLAGDPMFKGIGEWGFAALVQADGYFVSSSTRASARRPCSTMPASSVWTCPTSPTSSFPTITTTTSADLLTLRREFVKKNPKALSRVHVGRGIFWSRGEGDDGKEECRHRF